MDADTAPLERLLQERIWLRRLAGALVRDAHTADDLTQQAYLAAVEHAPRRLRSPRAWLAAVLRNLAKDRARAEGRRERRDAEHARLSAVPPPDALAARAEEAERVGRQVLALEAPYREVLLLRYFEDLPPRRIAARLGVPVETVRTRIKRALARLRQRLDAEHGGDRRQWAAPLLLWTEPPDPSLVPLLVGGFVVKKLIAVFVLLVVGIFLAVRWIPQLRDDDPPAEPPRAVVEEPGAEAEPASASLRGALDAVEEGEGAPPPGSWGWALVGRVVYPGRVPAAGVRVRLYTGRSAPEPDAEGLTDAKGRYRLHPRGPFDEGLRMFRLTAQDGEGNAASDEKWNVEVPREDDAEVRTLVLEASHALDLRVESESRPVPRAKIEVFNTNYQPPSRLAGLTTDGEGRARVEGLLPYMYRVEVSAEGLASEIVLVSLPQGESAPYRVSLDAPRTIDVQVVEAPEMRPLPGVEVRVFRQMAWGNHHQNHRLALPDEIPATDAEGRTRVAGVGRSPHLHLGILARGYAQPHYSVARKTWIANCTKTVAVPPDEDSVRIVVAEGRRVTWPLVRGDVPVPPDGTVVRLDVGRRGMRPFGVETGVIEDGRLVVDGLLPGYFTARGRTPGGLVARIVAVPKETEGAPLAFWRSRTLEVLVSDEEGTPFPKVSVRFDVDEGPQITTPFAHTDAEGVARWTDLPGLRGTVHPNLLPHGSHAVDLTEGDRRIEVRGRTPEAPGKHPLTIQVRLEGTPGLPDHYALGVEEYDASILLDREDEERATLYANWAPAPGRDAGRFVLEARGYQLAAFAVTTDTPEVEVNLERGCALRMAILHEIGQRPRYHLESYDGGARAWQEVDSRSAVRSGVTLKSLNPPRSGFERVVERLPPGRYRLVDDKTRRTSEVAELAVAGPVPFITLDCRPASEVKGRVVVPEGYAADEALVQVLVDDETTEVRADAKGGFAFPWPGDTGSVRLIARHPLLQPHATRGSVVLRESCEDLHLELVPGAIAEVELRVANPKDERLLPVRTVRVHLWARADSKGTATVLPAHLEGKEGGVWLLTFGGYDPGTWSLWCDVGYGFAPVRLEAVSLGELDPVLGPVTLTRGSTIRIRVETPDGKPPVLLSATATYEGAPPHQRFAADTDVSELVLEGLEAGRYRVLAGPVDPIRDEPPTAMDEVIEVDGTTAYERVIRAP